MRDLEETLRDAVHDLADDAPHAFDLAGAARTQGRRIRRRRHAAAGAFALVLLSGVAVPYAWLRQVPPTPVVQPTPVEPSPTVTAGRSATQLPNFSIKEPYRLPGDAVVTMITIPSTVVVDGAETSGPNTYLSLDRDVAGYRKLPFDRSLAAMSPDSDVLAISPDGERFAAEVSRNQIGVLDAEGRRLDTLNVDAYSRVGGDPVWSPDGSRLLVPTEDGFAVYETGTGKLREFQDPDIEPRCSDLCSFSWLPNGREFAVPREDLSEPRGEDIPDRIESVAVYSADTGARVRIIPMKGVPVGNQAWLPDGGSVLIREEQGIRVVDAVTGVPRGKRMAGPKAIYLSDGRILGYGSSFAQIYAADGTLLEEFRMPAQFAAGMTVEVARD
ncbi:WD40 repeat domain-containing protein [Actinoplanes philippinensis]|uniref:WD40 repeat domain-containing protein n=1 Tax=Actinoplanes philippinensis TaxID=35752 RepID=UPI0033E7A253